MWLSIPKQSRLVNLEHYSSVRIASLDKDYGFYSLVALEKGQTGFEDKLISPCSRQHAEKQLANILRSLSHGEKVCRVYDEDYSENNTRKEQPL